MTKRTVVALSICMLFMAGFLCAETAPKKILTEKDISAFIINYHTIQSDVELIGDKYEDFFDVDDVNLTDPGEMIAYIRALTVPAEVQSVFRKNGLGNNGFEKFIVISYGSTVLYMIETMDAQVLEYKDMPEMESFFAQANLGINSMRAALHEADLSLIKTRMPELLEVLIFEDEE